MKTNKKILFTLYVTLKRQMMNLKRQNKKLTLLIGIVMQFSTNIGKNI